MKEQGEEVTIREMTLLSLSQDTRCLIFEPTLFPLSFVRSFTTVQSPFLPTHIPCIDDQLFHFLVLVCGRIRGTPRSNTITPTCWGKKEKRQMPSGTTRRRSGKDSKKMLPSLIVNWNYSLFKSHHWRMINWFLVGCDISHHLLWHGSAIKYVWKDRCFFSWKVVCCWNMNSFPWEMILPFLCLKLCKHCYLGHKCAFVFNLN